MNLTDPGLIEELGEWVLATRARGWGVQPTGRHALQLIEELCELAEAIREGGPDQVLEEVIDCLFSATALIVDMQLDVQRSKARRPERRSMRSINLRLIVTIARGVGKHSEGRRPSTWTALEDALLDVLELLVGVVGLHGGGWDEIERLPAHIGHRQERMFDLAKSAAAQRGG